MTDPNFSAIRARLRYDSIEEFIEGYSRFISAGGMFIPMSPSKLKPIGTTIRFQFLLGDGSTALLGEGVVRQLRGPNDSGNDLVGMLVKFVKLSHDSKQLVDDIVSRKSAASEDDAPEEQEVADEPSAAEVDNPTAPAPPEAAEAVAAAASEPATADEDDPLDDLFLGDDADVPDAGEAATRERDQEDAHQTRPGSQPGNLRETAPRPTADDAQSFSSGEVFSEADDEADDTAGADVGDDELAADEAFSADEVFSDAQDDAVAQTPAPEEAAPAAPGPRALGKTEAGLQIMAFDDVEDEEAADFNDFFGGDEDDVDAMFDGIFGGGGGDGGDGGDLVGGGDGAADDFFGGPVGEDDADESLATDDADDAPRDEATADQPLEVASADEDDSFELLLDEEDDSPSRVEESPSEPEIVLEEAVDVEPSVANDTEEVDEADVVEAEALDDASEPEIVLEDEDDAGFDALLGDEASDEAVDDGLPEVPGAEESDLIDAASEAILDAEPSEPAVAEEPMALDQESVEEESIDEGLVEDSIEEVVAAAEQAEPAADDDSLDEIDAAFDAAVAPAEPESEEFALDSEAIELLDDDDLLDEDEPAPPSAPAPPPPSAAAPGSDEDAPGEEATAEAEQAPNEEILDLIGSLDESDAEDDLASFNLGAEEPEEAEPEAEAVEEEDESLEALLASAQKDIESRKSDEEEKKDKKDADRDILDQLLGDDDMPAPPSVAPEFDLADNADKKKGGFISKLFGKD